MNMTFNDRGEKVHAIGAPNSVVRAYVEFPNLLEKLGRMTEEDARAYLATTRYNPIQRETFIAAAFPSILGQIAKTQTLATAEWWKERDSQNA